MKSPSRNVFEEKGAVQKKIETHPELLQTFDDIVSSQTAGLPQDDTVKWTSLSCTQIIEAFKVLDISVSRYIVRQMLDIRGYKKRKLLKMKTLQEVEHRNEQFEKIERIRTVFENQQFLILSIDTKKKEMLDNFSRPGTCYSQAERKANDHDFASFSDGQIVPHGIYDVTGNVGYITLGTSKDTSEFVCENIYRVWTEHLQKQYSDTHTILLLCDGGGSNASGHYIVKQDLCKLSNKLGKNILVSHYPPYCSKFNPIEHRLFAHITRAWQGVALTDINIAKELSDRTSTRKGLKVFTHINSKEYETGRSVDGKFKNDFNGQITFDEVLPKWNYLIKPVG